DHDAHLCGGSERLLKQGGVNRNVERDGLERSVEDGPTVAQYRRAERHFDAVDLPIVGKHFFRLRWAAVGSRGRVRLPRDSEIMIDIEADRIEPFTADLEHLH